MVFGLKNIFYDEQGLDMKGPRCEVQQDLKTGIFVYMLGKRTPWFQVISWIYCSFIFYSCLLPLPAVGAFQFGKLLLAQTESKES